jgi:hypothetical protein
MEDGADAPRYVRTGWTDPGVEESATPPDDVDRVLRVWLRERRRLVVGSMDGTEWEAQLIGVGRDALYLVGEDGQARIVFRHGLRYLAALEREGTAIDGPA